MGSNAILRTVSEYTRSSRRTVWMQACVFQPQHILSILLHGQSPRATIPHWENFCTLLQVWNNAIKVIVTAILATWRNIRKPSTLSAHKVRLNPYSWFDERKVMLAKMEYNFWLYLSRARCIHIITFFCCTCRGPGASTSLSACCFDAPLVELFADHAIFPTRI